MKEKHTSYTLNTLPKSKTNWEKVKKLTETEINQAALADVNAQPLSGKDLAKFKKER